MGNKKTTEKRRFTLTKEELTKIKDMYQKGYLLYQIAEELNRSKPTIISKVKVLIARGELEPRTADVKLSENGTVYCKASVAKRCVYGNSMASPNLCNYILITGKRRGCPYAECDKFERITSENPRRLCMNDALKGIL